MPQGARKWTGKYMCTYLCIIHVLYNKCNQTVYNVMVVVFFFPTEHYTSNTHMDFSMSFFLMVVLRSHSLPCPNLSNYAPIVSHQDCFPFFAFTSNGIIASKALMRTNLWAHIFLGSIVGCRVAR